MKRAPENTPPVARTPDGKWIGSGNPGGRPKSLRELELYSQEYTREAIDEFVRVMRDSDAPPIARLRAGELIIERAYGKPRQPLDHTTNGEKLHLVSPMATVAELRKVCLEIEANEKFSEGRESILPEGVLQ